MLFAAAWLVPGIFLLSEVSQKDRSKHHMISHMWNLKYNPNEPMYKNRQTQRTDLQLPRERGWGRKGLGDRDEQMQTIIYRMDK